jgi:predicted component of type VI protein secretion system
MNHAEQIRQQCEKRAKLWQEYVATYQKVLQESPEAFSAFSAEFRERYLRVSLNH